MKNNLLYITLICLTLSLYNCKDQPETQKSLTREVTFTKEADLILKKAKTDSVIATLEVELADDEYQTQTGLMYRHSMAANQGMLFVFDDEVTRTFYMKNTEIPLDIIYINSKREVVNIQKNAKPYDETSLPSDGPVMFVLEVNAGLTEKWNVEKGDLVVWQ